MVKTATNQNGDKPEWRQLAQQSKRQHAKSATGLMFACSFCGLLTGESEVSLKVNHWQR